MTSSCRYPSASGKKSGSAVVPVRGDDRRAGGSRATTQKLDALAPRPETTPAARRELCVRQRSGDPKEDLAIEIARREGIVERPQGILVVHRVAHPSRAVGDEVRDARDEEGQERGREADGDPGADAPAAIAP